jgi:hypothetical protein
VAASVGGLLLACFKRWTRKGSKDFSRDGWIRVYCSRLLLVSFAWRKEQKKDSMRGSARAAKQIALVRNRMLVSLRGGGGELGNLKP